MAIDTDTDMALDTYLDMDTGHEHEFGQSDSRSPIVVFLSTFTKSTSEYHESNVANARADAQYVHTYIGSDNFFLVQYYRNFEYRTYIGSANAWD
jgi:hypothetical protein